METLEWTKHSDAMFKSWTDAQTNMWNEWLKAMQGFGIFPSSQVWNTTIGKFPSSQVWDKTIEAGKENNMGTRTGNAVVEMLKQDHQTVKKLFEEFNEAEGKAKAEIAKTVIQELEVHADLEERLIYPAIRDEVDADDMMNEAVEEHHLVHVLIAELKKLKPSDERFDAKFNVLGELVTHHIEEEEGEILPQAEDSKIDWEELTSRVMKRKEQLVAKHTSTSRKRR